MQAEERRKNNLISPNYTKKKKETIGRRVCCCLPGNQRLAVGLRECLVFDPVLPVRPQGKSWTRDYREHFLPSCSDTSGSRIEERMNRLFEQKAVRFSLLMFASDS